ncbi:MAG: hypothetical protein KAJ20_03340 [Candidatus Aenigmarchaeota archaeon]|nr:hypothetical protein [Candidatus Aenigmarchaeota archaeon]MCK5062787.1 hypothetical protein [Candidatus Aenigmarchaeota archaeon]MCK5289951.1 hypothetical protein [Candidatus Aenigmarchaeota archaeon]MCK5373346.1 hypothetical protein [Candidatus Aenigmarchaeota archaeon]
METDNLSFIDLIRKSLCDVNPDDLEQFYTALYPDRKTGIYIDGQIGGRSLQAAKVGLNRLAYILDKVNIYGAGDSLSPGRNTAEKMNNLALVCGKVNYLGVSGSGRSKEIIGNIEKLKKFSDNDNFMFNVITSYSDSPMGKLLQQYGGNILTIKGRKSKDTQNSEYIKEGLLEDLFELACVEATSIIARGIKDEIAPKNFYNYYIDTLDELECLKNNISDIKKTPAYEEFLELLSNPARRFLSFGQSVSNEVVKMNNNRMGHVRPLTAELIGLEPNIDLGIGANKNEVMGESNTKDPDKNTVFLAVSKSGTGIAEGNLKQASDTGAQTFLLTKKGLHEKKFVLDTDNFYAGSCLFLSSCLMDVGNMLVEKGVSIDDSVLRALHVNDKIGKQ